MQMESLRLCHPLGSSSKLPKGTPTLKVGDQTYTVPADTNLQVNFCAIHTNPKYWGSNNVFWDPARFVYIADGAVPGLENELLRPDTEKHYFPWSSGQRICPGKKFSQVELVATMAILFHDYRVDPVPEAGESLGDARKRAQHVSLDIQQTLLNEMFAPESVGLLWKEQ
jgi:cytochrome P450